MSVATSTRAPCRALKPATRDRGVLRPFRGRRGADAACPRVSARRSAPCLVRAKTSTRSWRLAPAGASSSAALLGPARRGAPRASIVSAGALPRRDLDRPRVLQQARARARGPRPASSPRRAASGARVGSTAIRVGCRGMNPMSSMRSASSSTSTSSRDRSTTRSSDVVEQAAGRGDHHVHALAQRALLRVAGDAAEDARSVRWVRCRPESSNDCADLRRQFTRRRQHEQPRCARTSRAGLRFAQPLQNRQRERGGLAGAGLGARQQVAALEDGGNGALLDGRRLDVAQFLHGAQQFGREAELIKRHSSYHRASPAQAGTGRSVIDSMTGSGARNADHDESAGGAARGKPAVLIGDILLFRDSEKGECPLLKPPVSRRRTSGADRTARRQTCDALCTNRTRPAGRVLQALDFKARPT